MDQSVSPDAADVHAIVTQLASGFIADTAFRHLGFVLIAIIILCGAFSFIARRGETALGLNLKDAINDIEAAAKLYVNSKGISGTVWPLTGILLALFAGAIAIVLAVIQ